MPESTGPVSYDPVAAGCQLPARDRIEVYGPKGSPHWTELLRSVYGCRTHTPQLVAAAEAEGLFAVDIPMFPSTDVRCGFSFHYGHPAVAERVAGLRLAHAKVTHGVIVDLDEAARAVAQALTRTQKEHTA